jgi:putative methyltransferase (TIGR04325 family)
MRATGTRAAIQYLLPPALLDLARWLKRVSRRRPPPWERVPGGWAELGRQPKIKGWNEESVVGVYRRRWAAFAAYVATSLPMAVGPEHEPPAHLDHGLSTALDLTMHNIVMSYAYAVGLASREKSRVSLLDWGGGAGHYYLLTRALLPHLELDYHCRDLERVVAFGEAVLPTVHFHSNDNCLDRRYDFVLASSSFQYSENWKSQLGKLVSATAGYLFVTQLPIIHQAPSFVFVQRPYDHGYNTEYLGWCLNRGELLEQARQHGLVLTREFICGFQPPIHDAPEPAEYRGFLFRRVD